MAVLVLVDHDGTAVAQPTRSAVAAAQKLGEVHALVLGPQAVAQEVSQVAGVAKVLHSDAEIYAHGLAEPTAALLVALAPEYSHLLAPASAAGKNVMPRVAALLDVQVISDIAGVVDSDTFVRPIYAGNALATVKSADPKKVRSLRTAASRSTPLLSAWRRSIVSRWSRE